jgi:glucoamylase
MWAHTEYIKLLRSTKDGKVFDLIPAVANRYLGDRSKCKSLEIWKFNRQVRRVKRGITLRVQALTSFQLHWTKNGWETVVETDSISTSLNIHYVDIPITIEQCTPVVFTFLWF